MAYPGLHAYDSGTSASLEILNLQQTIDLLYETPSSRVSLKLLERALVFAFSAGDTDGAFETVLNKAEAGPSSYTPDSFASDLFLDDFVRDCLPLRIHGDAVSANQAYLGGILCHPPLDRSTTEYRRQIFKELGADPRQRQALEEIYLTARSLRTLLGRADFTARMDQVARRVDILQRVRKTFKLMAGAFGDCQSGLASLREFGEQTVASEGFMRLSDVLEYEQHAADVELKLRLGVDGSIRSLQLASHRDNQESSFYAPRLTRFWTRLKMLLQGYRFTERELVMRLLDQVFDGIKPRLLQVFQLIGDIEFYLCGLGFQDAAASNDLRCCFPEFVASRGETDQSTPGIEVDGLYNPFLLAKGVAVKTCDLRAGQDAIVVITGPNSGGKTRLLQSMALVHLLAHCGMPVPARRAQLAWTRGMFVSLVDDVSADQREGRLGMELVRIRNLFERINVGDLVVLDELCSGTNPSEGERIFQLVIELLAELKPQVWLTTHFLSFAATLDSQRRLKQLQFLQVELGQQNQPTYRFVPGVASTSLAGQTAERLGVTRRELERLIAEAKARQTANPIEKQARPNDSAATNVDEHDAPPPNP